MAGHSHWAGIKHKKGRQDKLRSKIFSKISREITVAAKLGSKDPQSNPRLRSAIESAKDANMPKDNINRAISKSDFDKEKNYESLRYEGFGPNNIALIIETLTENKNRTAGSIRTILQKHGGNLGNSGSTTHYFNNCGVIQFSKQNISDEQAFELDKVYPVKTYDELVTMLDEHYYGNQNKTSTSTTESTSTNTSVDDDDDDDLDFGDTGTSAKETVDSDKVKELLDTLD